MGAWPLCPTDPPLRRSALGEELLGHADVRLPVAERAIERPGDVVASEDVEVDAVDAAGGHLLLECGHDRPAVAATAGRLQDLDLPDEADPLAPVVAHAEPEISDQLARVGVFCGQHRLAGRGDAVREEAGKVA